MSDTTFIAGFVEASRFLVAVTGVGPTRTAATDGYSAY